jgi:hypothetical protein
VRHSVSSQWQDIASVGDVDGDGFDDLAMTAATGFPQEPGDDPRTIDHCIFFGREVLPQAMTLEEELANGGACKYLSGGAEILQEGIGDQNGDGRDDIGVFNGTMLRVLYGDSRAVLARPRSLWSSGDFAATFLSSPGYNGMLRAFRNGGDFTGDGVPELLISDDHLVVDALPPSRAIMVFGSDLAGKAGYLDAVEDKIDLLSYDIAHENGKLGFPVRFESAGDVNGDGLREVVVFDDGHMWIYFNPRGATREAFLRGDANQDARLDIADAIKTLSYLFGGAPMPCMDAADANDDEQVNIADAIRILSFLFGSGARPPLPPPNECGPDPVGDSLGCADSICD